MTMNLEEAQAWLQGSRSLTNSITCDPLETWQGRIAEADAAMIQQAYWIVKAHKESLVGPKWNPSDEELTAIYMNANEVLGKNPPITTERVFAAMREMIK